MFSKNKLKLILYLFMFIFFTNTVYSSNFNVCGIDFNHNWFEVKDDSNNTVFLLDKDGDVFIMGKNNVGSNPALRSFKINDAIYFNAKDAPLNKIFQTGSFPAEKGILFKDSSGNNIGKLTTSGLYVKGTPAYQGSQAKCPADGWGYCNANNQFLRDNRDYYCDITGSKSGQCEYSVTSTYNCNNDNYYSCSGNNKILKKFRCELGNCAHYQDDVISSCSAYQYCYGAGLCGNYVWKTGSWGGCSVLCGSGTQTRSVTCTRSHDGAVVDNSYCNPATKPATSQGCSISCSWNTGSWGSCSAYCGSGTQYRSVYCVNQLGQSIADYYCSGSKPATAQSCYASCNWEIGSWGSCSASCCGGTQTRSLYCYNNYGSLVPNSYCNTFLGYTPTTSQTCNTGDCCTYSNYYGCFDYNPSCTNSYYSSGILICYDGWAVYPGNDIGSNQWGWCPGPNGYFKSYVTTGSSAYRLYIQSGNGCLTMPAGDPRGACAKWEHCTRC